MEEPPTDASHAINAVGTAQDRAGTRILSRRLVCGLCGREVEVPWLVASHREGPSDLDTRPPFMERGTIAVWIAECPACGLCAYDLSRAGERASDVVRSAAYARILRDPSRRAIANRFLCASMILSAEGEHVRAFWAALHAAWACDDDDRPRGAAECRGVAIDHAERARAEGRPIEEGPGAEEVVLADVYRRSARFSEAARKVREGLVRRPDPAVLARLDLERRLIRRKDSVCHTEAEAAPVRT